MSLRDYATLRSISCLICSSRLERNPKTLLCHHTFCRQCLALLLSTDNTLNMVTCPICQHNTPVVNGNLDCLDTDVRVQSMIYAVTNLPQLCTNCDLSRNEAEKYCEICDLFLCNMCLGKHDFLKSTRSHPIFLVDDIRKGRVFLDKKIPCKNHTDDEGRHVCTLVCISCNKAICEKCRDVVHREHDVQVLTEYKAKSQERSMSLQHKADVELGNAKCRIQSVMSAERATSTHINSVIRSTRESAATIIQEVGNRENILIKQSENHKQNISQRYQEFRKADERMKTQVESASDLLRRSTSCQFSADTVAIRTYLTRRLTGMVTSEVEEIEFNTQLAEITRAATQIEFIPDGNKLLLGHITFNDIVSSSPGPDTSTIYPTVPPPTPLAPSDMAGTDRWVLISDITLPPESPMQCLTATPDGKLAVGRMDTGIIICSRSGHVEKKPSISVVSDVAGLAFTSKGYCVARTRCNKMAMFTAYWDLLDVKFKPAMTTGTFLKTGPCGNLTVDGDDNIYVNHIRDGTIEVFASTGGKPLRTIDCRGLETHDIFAMKSRKVLVVSSGGQSVSIIDECGRIKKQVNKDGEYVFCAVRPDDSILLARVKPNARLLTIEHYSQDLDHLDTIISDKSIRATGKRDWFALQETSNGNIAFCTSERLYLFSRSSK